MIGHADAAVLWFVLSGGQIGERTRCLSVFFFAELQTVLNVGSELKAPVVVGDDGRKRSGADAVTNQVDLLGKEKP